VIAESGALWAITCSFSPVRSRQRIDNYQRFRSALTVPLATIEATFDDQAELTSADADLYLRIGGADVLWQKERLLNVMLQHLPPQCKYVAWVDGDVLFEDPYWPQQTIDSLANAPVVQLFSSLHYLEPETARQESGMRVESVAAAVHRGQSPSAALSNVTNRTGGAASPGMAWAARRELLQRHGLFDSCIIGGGDTAMACAAYGVPEVAMELHYMNEHQRRHYGRWATRFHEDVGGCVTALKGEIQHLWHGELASRRAGKRHTDLRVHNFNPDADIAHSQEGAWRWASNKLQLHALLKNYFSSRATGDCAQPASPYGASRSLY
jgi:hypothetical protein